MSGVTSGGFTPSEARGVPHQMSTPAPGWEVHLSPGERVVGDRFVPHFAVTVLGPDGARVRRLCRYGIGSHAEAKRLAREAWRIVRDEQLPAADSTTTV